MMSHEVVFTTRFFHTTYNSICTRWPVDSLGKKKYHSKICTAFFYDRQSQCFCTEHPCKPCITTELRLIVCKAADDSKQSKRGRLRMNMSSPPMDMDEITTSLQIPTSEFTPTIADALRITWHAQANFLQTQEIEVAQRLHTYNAVQKKMQENIRRMHQQLKDIKDLRLKIVAELQRSRVFFFALQHKTVGRESMT